MRTRFGILRVLKVIIMATLFINVVGYGTMHLWNWLVPVLFHGPVITFFQAIGLIVLGKILFGGFRGYGGGGRRYYWRQRMLERYENMSPEEKVKFRTKMQGRCGGRFSQDEQTSQVTE